MANIDKLTRKSFGNWLNSQKDTVVVGDSANPLKKFLAEIKLNVSTLADLYKNERCPNWVTEFPTQMKAEGLKNLSVKRAKRILATV